MALYVVNGTLLESTYVDEGLLLTNGSFIYFPLVLFIINLMRHKFIPSFIGEKNNGVSIST